MKRILFSIILLSFFVLIGCSAPLDVEKYSTQHFSVEFPNTYIAEQNDEQLTLLGENGKIIIGGFLPAQGHPDPKETHFPFQMISYSADPKMEHDLAIAAALYFQHGDEETKEELLKILASVK